MPVDPARVLVWQLGGALLAVDVHEVIEIAALDRDGTAHSRQGELEVLSVPGARPSGTARRAVVVRTGPRVAAIPADVVEGVADPVDTRQGTPGWLATLGVDHIRGLLHLEERRVGTLLALDVLLPDP